MSRIGAKFEQLKSSGPKGFIPFITAGDPDLDTTRRLVLTLAQEGADIVELGVPFSDPMADGPTIQASSMRALANGTKLANILEIVAELRRETQVPIVLFSYLNPLYRRISKQCIIYMDQNSSTAGRTSSSRDQKERGWLRS